MLMLLRNSRWNQELNVSFIFNISSFLVLAFYVSCSGGMTLSGSCVFPYWETADIDLATITDRMAVKKAVQCGNVEDAIEKVNDLNPEVRLFIMLLQSMRRWLVCQLYTNYGPCHRLSEWFDYIVCLFNLFSQTFSFLSV
jgi:hypothetical protein